MDVFVVIAQYHDRSGAKLVGVYDNQHTAESLVAAMEAVQPGMAPILLAATLNATVAQDIAS